MSRSMSPARMNQLGRIPSGSPLPEPGQVELEVEIEPEMGVEASVSAIPAPEDLGGDSSGEEAEYILTEPSLSNVSRCPGPERHARKGSAPDPVPINKLWNDLENSHHVSKMELLDIFRRRLWHMAPCLILYCVMLLAFFVVLIWEAVWGHDRWVVFGFELTITLLLVGEVMLGMLIFRRKYFKYWANVFDFLLTLACVVIFLVVTILRTEDTPLAHLHSAAIAVRYTVQILRMCWLFYTACTLVKAKMVDDVVLPSYCDDLAWARISKQNTQTSTGNSQVGGHTPQNFKASQNPSPLPTNRTLGDLGEDDLEMVELNILGERPVPPEAVIVGLAGSPASAASFTAGPTLPTPSISLLEADEAHKEAEQLHMLSDSPTQFQEIGGPGEDTVIV